MSISNVNNSGIVNSIKFTSKSKIWTALSNLGKKISNFVKNIFAISFDQEMNSADDVKFTKEVKVLQASAKLLELPEEATNYLVNHTTTNSLDTTYVDPVIC